MRIAYLSTFYPLRGGIAQFNAALYRELEKEHNVKAFTFKRQYPEKLFPGETQYVQEGDNADTIDSLEVLDSINPVSYLQTAKQIREFEPDLLIMKYWMSFFAPSLGTVARKMSRKTKVISILDNVIPHEKRFFDKSFTSFFLKQNDGFVAMSKKVEDDLYSFQAEAKCLHKPHPLYNHFGEKVDRAEAARKLGIDPDKKTLLFFGFIRDYKGLDVLIDAFNRLSGEYQLVIAGECYGSFDVYQKMIDDSPKKKSIFPFVKYIGDNEVPLFFSVADVCMLPYKTATQSGISSIALHFETPMIATNTGGLAETIHDGKTGIIAPHADPQEIKDAICEFFATACQVDYIDNIHMQKESLSWENFAHSLVDFSKTLHK